MKSDTLYSTDSEFYYVDGKLEQISDFYREMKGRGVQDPVHTVDVMNNYIDPIYEMIPEASEAEDTYCLPQDSRPNQGKVKISKSQDALRSLCRSISSPMRMNEYLMNRVKRSNSNHNSGEDGAVREGDHTWLREAKSRTEERGQKRAEDNRNQRTTQSESRGQRIEPSLRLGSQRAQGSTLSLVPSEKTSPSVSSGVTYTNLDNLKRTIRLQQEGLLRERKEERLRSSEEERRGTARFSVPPPPSHPPPSHEAATAFRNEGNDQEKGSDGTWEWKIKVRPDGSRYIARRPVRSHLLRERGRKIEEERGGNTTDDDAMSEVKVGKFWTKDKRKKQFEVARERRRRQEEVIRAKTVSLRQGLGGGGKRISYHEEGSSEPVMVATV